MAEQAKRADNVPVPADAAVGVRDAAYQALFGYDPGRTAVGRRAFSAKLGRADGRADRVPWTAGLVSGGARRVRGRDGRLVDRRGPYGENRATCRVLTVLANDTVKPVHDRMPLILNPADYARRPDPGTPAGEPVGLMSPPPPTV